MDPCFLQWRLYNHNIRNANLWSIKYNVYADQHRHVTLMTTYSNYIYRIMIVEVPNLLSMISMFITWEEIVNLGVYGVECLPRIPRESTRTQFCVGIVNLHLGFEK
jgi:hypothetical protein